MSSSWIYFDFSKSSQIVVICDLWYDNWQIKTIILSHVFMPSITEKFSLILSQKARNLKIHNGWHIVQIKRKEIVKCLPLLFCTLYGLDILREEPWGVHNCCNQYPSCLFQHPTDHSLYILKNYLKVGRCIGLDHIVGVIEKFDDLMKVWISPMNTRYT